MHYFHVSISELELSQKDSNDAKTSIFDGIKLQKSGAEERELSRAVFVHAVAQIFVT